MNSIRVRAYCSSANLGSGFDIVAVALDAYYDEVALNVKEGDGRVRIVDVIGPYSSYVDIKCNTVKYALEYMIKRYDLNVNVDVKLWKGIPVGYGLGSSGASAAAAVKALDEVLKLRLDVNELVKAAGEGERASAGEPHYDNVSASLLGGFIAILSHNPLKVTSVGKPNVKFILVTPKVKVPPRKTEIMRKVLPKSVGLKDHVHNTSYLTALILGILRNNHELLRLGMRDDIVEPARSKAVPCYDKVRSSMLKHGITGIALSGAGPSIIILYDESYDYNTIVNMLINTYRECNVDVDVKLTRPSIGAEVVGYR